MAHGLTFTLLTGSSVEPPWFPLASLANVAVPTACFAFFFDGTRAGLDERSCLCHADGSPDGGTFSASPSVYRAPFLPGIAGEWMMWRSKEAERLGRAGIRAREAR